MNIRKILKIVIIVLSVILVSIISFWGLFKKEQNQMVDIIPDYRLGMDLKGGRNVTLTPVGSTTVKYYDAEGNEADTTNMTDEQKEALTKKDVLINEESSKNWDNYKLVESIMTSRLDQMEVPDYVLSADKDNGTIQLSIPESNSTNTIIQSLIQTGEFQIVDSETKEVLLDNTSIKDAKVGYSSNASGTTSIYLSIEFNKEGKAKLKEITGVYKKVETDANTTNTTEQSTENQEKERKVVLSLDGSEILTTAFDSVIEDGKIQLSMGSGTADTIQDSILSASNLALLINNSKLPIKYEVEVNQFVSSSVLDMKNVYFIVGIIAIAIMFAVLVMKYRLKGLISSIGMIGYIAVLLLVIRFTNVDLSLDGIMAIGLSFVLAYIFDILLLKKISNKEKKDLDYKKEFNEMIMKFYFNMVIVLIVAVVFCFALWLPIYSFGLTLFWGLIVLFIYHELVTRYYLKAIIKE